MTTSSILRVISPTVLLYTFVVIMQLGNGAYYASGAEPLPAFSFISAVGFLWIVGWWLLRDSTKRGIGLVLDTGMFLYLAWPVVMPYYLLKTRGAKGLLLILAYVGASVGAYTMGFALYSLIAPSNR